jgi:hypothetical protein
MRKPNLKPSDVDSNRVWGDFGDFKKYCDY